MADWASDVKKYAPNADDKVIAGVVRHCGIALHKVDSSLVSFSDQAELDRVKKGFLTKKLEVATDAEKDAALAAVGEKMKGVNRKNRVTVYYLLAEHFGKLSLFG
jgi:predicted NBD/HSP70 family sugar kinase